MFTNPVLSGKCSIWKQCLVRNASCVLFENLSSSLRELMEFLKVLYGISTIVMMKFLILVLFQAVRYHMYLNQNILLFMLRVGWYQLNIKMKSWIRITAKQRLLTAESIPLTYRIYQVKQPTLWNFGSRLNRGGGSLVRWWLSKIQIILWKFVKTVFLVKKNRLRRLFWAKV